MSGKVENNHAFYIFCQVLPNVSSEIPLILTVIYLTFRREGLEAGQLDCDGSEDGCIRLCELLMFKCLQC